MLFNKRLNKTLKEHDGSSNKLLIQQSNALQNTYNNNVYDLVEKEIASVTEITLSNSHSGKLAEKILDECNIDTKEILNEGIKINENNPNISEKDLSIELLHKIADNKKYKKMSKIAREMLKERWWEKNE